MADDRRAAKQSVLTKVNSVLATAGLNDTVWSVRDCDSTLFVLMYKKIVGKVRPPTSHAISLFFSLTGSPWPQHSCAPFCLVLAYSSSMRQPTALTFIPLLPVHFNVCPWRGAFHSASGCRDTAHVS